MVKRNLWRCSNLKWANCKISFDISNTSAELRYWGKQKLKICGFEKYIRKKFKTLNLNDYFLIIIKYGVLKVKVMLKQEYLSY